MKNLVYATGIVCLCFACGATTNERNSEVYAEGGASESVGYKEEYAEAEEAYEEAAEGEAGVESNYRNNSTPVSTKQAIDNFSSNFMKTDNLPADKKFRKQADARFLVNNVFESVQFIETQAIKTGGWIEYSQFNSRTERTRWTKVSKDSVLHHKYYHNENSICLRIPSDQVHDFLKQVATQIVYLENRNIGIDDLTFRFVEEDLEKRRAEKYKELLAQHVSQSKSASLEDKTYAVESMMRKQYSEDMAFIQKMRLEDQVKYSTLTFNIYGNQKSMYWKTFVPESIRPYEPAFGDRSFEALTMGWKGIKLFVVGLLYAWPVFIIGLPAFVYYRRKRKNKKA
jgi:hypothetical protein